MHAVVLGATIAVMGWGTTGCQKAATPQGVGEGAKAEAAESAIPAMLQGTWRASKPGRTIPSAPGLPPSWIAEMYVRFLSDGRTETYSAHRNFRMPDLDGSGQPVVVSLRRTMDEGTYRLQGTTLSARLFGGDAEWTCTLIEGQPIVLRPTEKDDRVPFTFERLPAGEELPKPYRFPAVRLDALYARKQRDPKNAKTHLELGNALSAIGDTTEALKAYTTAIELDPEFQPAYHRRAKLYATQESHADYDKAIDDLTAVLAKNPRDPEALSHRSWYYYRRACQMQRFVKVNEKYKLMPDQAGPTAAAVQRDLALALQDSEKAIRLRPQSAAAYNCRGMYHRQVGNMLQARADLEMAIKLDPDYEPPHFNLGLLLLSQGKRPEATYQFCEAIRVQPGNRDALLRRSEIYAQSGYVCYSRFDTARAANLEQFSRLRALFAEKGHYMAWNRVEECDIYATAQLPLLCFAVERDDLSIVEMLLKDGADSNYPARDGTLPVHLACRNCARVGDSVGRQYLEGNAVLGVRPSHCWRILRLLIQHGANLDAPTPEGQTAYDLLTEGKLPLTAKTKAEVDQRIDRCLAHEIDVVFADVQAVLHQAAKTAGTDAAIRQGIAHQAQRAMHTRPERFMAGVFDRDRDVEDAQISLDAVAASVRSSLSMAQRFTEQALWLADWAYGMNDPRFKDVQQRLVKINESK